AGRLKDVDEPLVRADLELLARLAVNVRAAQHGIPLDARRHRNGATHRRPGAHRRLDDLAGGAIEDLVVVGLHFDAYPFAGVAGHNNPPRDFCLIVSCESVTIGMTTGAVKAEQSSFSLQSEGRGAPVLNWRSPLRAERGGLVVGQVRIG